MNDNIDNVFDKMFNGTMNIKSGRATSGSIGAVFMEVFQDYSDIKKIEPTYYVDKDVAEETIRMVTPILGNVINEHIEWAMNIRRILQGVKVSGDNMLNVELEEIERFILNAKVKSDS